MIGTIVNTAAILIGSAVGSIINKGIKPAYQGALFNAMGLAALMLGINAAVSNMSESIYPVLFIASLAIGSLIGTIVDLNGKFERLTGRLTSPRQSNAKKGLTKESTAKPDSTASGSAKPDSTASGTAKPDSSASGSAKRDLTNLGEGLSTAILLFCIGTLSIVGPIESAINGNHTYLFTNATLDLVSAMVLASTYGIGIALAAIVLFFWQGAIFLGASFLSGFLTAPLMTEISIVGGVLIATSGLSILKIKDCKTMNMLPSLLIPIVWFLIVGAGR